MSTTIDLGKLRFNWVGVWSSSTQYEVNDLVKYGGDVYVYIYALKTSGNVTTDTTYWSLVQEGLSWKGEYSAATAYKIHEVVHHSNNAYVNILSEPSAGNEPPNSTYWNVLATGIKFEGEYNNATAYQKDDIVYYGANTYICLVNSSGGNLPTDTAYWGTFSHGLAWEGIYVAATAYQRDDVVSYGAGVYIAKVDTTGNLPTDTTKWDVLTSGIKYTAAWSPSKADYRISDIATFGGNAYIATADNPTAGSDPSVNTAQWDVLASGLQFEGVWAVGTAYQKDDVVSYGANTYIALLTNTGQNPETATSSWEKMTSGLRSRDVWATATAYLTDDIVSYGGQTFKALVGHASGTFATDLAAAKWIKFSAGIDWKGTWVTSTAYKVNDLVNDSGSVYIATTDHTSTTFAGDAAYWTLFVNAGTDITSVLSTQGDVLYRNATVPASLAAGTSGQVLTTQGSGADPIWADGLGANSVGVVQLNLADGSAGQVIETDGAGTISFTTVSSAPAANSVGVVQLNLADGTADQVIQTDGAGTISFVDAPPPPNPIIAQHLVPLTSQSLFSDINWISTNTQTYGWLIQRTTGVASGVAQFALVQGGVRTIAAGGAVATILPFQINADNSMTVGTAAKMWTNTAASVDFSTCSIVHDDISGLFAYSGNIPFPPATTHVMGYGAGALNANNTAGNFSYYGGNDRGVHNNNGQYASVHLAGGNGFRGVNAGYASVDSRTRIHQLEFTSASSMTTNYQNPSANTSTSPILSLLTQDNLSTSGTALSGVAHWRNGSSIAVARVFNAASSAYTDYVSSGDFSAPLAAAVFPGVQLSNGKTLVWHGGDQTFLYTSHNSRTNVHTAAGASKPPWTTNYQWLKETYVWVANDTWVVMNSVSGAVVTFEKWTIDPSTYVWSQIGTTFNAAIYGNSSYQHLKLLPNNRLMWTLRAGQGTTTIKILNMPAFT